VLTRAGANSELPSELAGRVELAIRARDDCEFWFLINRKPERLLLAGLEGDLISGGEESHEATGRT
jgi:beta-galactosidase